MVVKAIEIWEGWPRPKSGAVTVSAVFSPPFLSFLFLFLSSPAVIKHTAAICFLSSVSYRRIVTGCRKFPMKYYPRGCGRGFGGWITAAAVRQGAGRVGVRGAGGI